MLYTDKVRIYYLKRMVILQLQACLTSLPGFYMIT